MKISSVLFTVLLLLSAVPDRVLAQAGQPSLVARRGGDGTSAPAVLALQHWDSLGLTPAQVQGIRALQAELLSALSQRFEDVDGASAALSSLWLGTPLDTLALKSDLERELRRDYSLIVTLVATGQKVFALLDADQRELLRSLHQRELERAREALLPSTPPSCTRGGSSGGISFSDRAMVTYSVSFEGDTAQLGMVFVGRADQPFGGGKPREKPVIPDAPEFLSGGTMGSWWVQYHRETGRAWIQGQEIELGSGNVVLLRGVDSLHEVPQVVRTLRIPAEVYTGGCGEHGSWSEILRTHLEANPEVRAFLDGQY